MANGTFTLIVRHGDEQTTHTFDQDRVVIGRSRECDVVLPDRLVSRTHCRVERRDGRLFLVDEGAQNPVKLRGAPVTEEPLAAGDVFSAGGCEIELARGQDEAPSLDETALVDGPQNAKDLEAFVRVARALNEESDLSKLLTAIVDAAIELSGAERGFLILGEADTSTVEIARNFAQEEVHTPEFKISRTVAQRVRESGLAELTTNAQEDARFSSLASVADLRLRSVLCIPLRIRGTVEGVLYVDNRLQNQVFKEREKALLMSLADHAGIAIHNARTMRELRTKHGELQAAHDRVAQLNAALRGQVAEQMAEIADMREQLDQSSSRRGEFRHDYSRIVGTGRRMREVFTLLDKYIEAEDPVLILGESGTGKELIARALHELGPRKDRPFVSENCAALPESLLESELFGYAKGAFTGADKAHDGLFVAASGGVLFLDEVGEMHVDLQKKLLRVLQEGEVRPLGSQKVVSVDVRLITATNRNLEELCRDGEFREDLFYRLAVLPITVPPLRERREDIPFLVDRFLTDVAREEGGAKPRISADALEALVAHRWPGNVRELQNEIRRASILADGVIMKSHLSERVREPGTGEHTGDGLVPAECGTTLPDMVRDLEMREIAQAMKQSGGNKSRTAEMLGVSRFALQRKLEKYGLEGNYAPAEKDADAS